MLTFLNETALHFPSLCRYRHGPLTNSFAFYQARYRPKKFVPRLPKRRQSLPKIRHHVPLRRTEPKRRSPSEPVYVPVAFKRPAKPRVPVPLFPKGPSSLASQPTLKKKRPAKPHVPVPLVPKEARQASRPYFQHQLDTTHATRIVPVACAPNWSPEHI
jgi:hypothetical protein